MSELYHKFLCWIGKHDVVEDGPTTNRVHCSRCEWFDYLYP